MAREDVFLTRQSSFPALAEAKPERAVVNRAGFQVVTDMFTHLVLGGFAYHMQIGTEDDGVVSTGAIDDQLAWMLADNDAGYAMIPLLYEINPFVLSADCTIIQAMLEVDKDKVRYASGGVAVVPANLNNADPRAASGAFYITVTADNNDIVAAAKTAVPNSVELARKVITENALANSIGYPGTWKTLVYTVRERPVCVMIDASSAICHFGAATSDVTESCGAFQFAQIEKGLVV